MTTVVCGRVRYRSTNWRTFDRSSAAYATPETVPFAEEIGAAMKMSGTFLSCPITTSEITILRVCTASLKNVRSETDKGPGVSGGGTTVCTVPSTAVSRRTSNPL